MSLFDVKILIIQPDPDITKKDWSLWPFWNGKDFGPLKDGEEFKDEKEARSMILKLNRRNIKNLSVARVRKDKNRVLCLKFNRIKSNE